MRHRLVTKKQCGVHVIVGHRLVSEFESPQRPQDVEKPPEHPLFDEKGRHRYVLTASGIATVAASTKEIAQEAQERANEEARAFLRKTDWYIIREADTGTPVPEDVKAQRQAAREAVSE